MVTILRALLNLGEYRRMTFRLFASFLLGMSLMSMPASAKDEPAPPPAKTYTTVIDPNPAHQPENVLNLDLSNGGRVSIRLMPDWAPAHVERIKTLVAQNFYNGVIFHRVIDGFMAQTGDPTGTGQGGSELPDLKAEFNTVPHVRGTVSMARTNEPDSANSQFFIVFYPRFALDNKYTVFGRVIGGMDVVDRIERGEPPENPTRIVRASLGTDGVPPPAAQAPAPAAIGASQLNSSVSD
jgi:cyclophilin family peptidyl-prolyl cis-trans isomerase